ncbi:transposase [Bergeyella zoohelcum]|uniref:transposase n=2 Tax=Bergeyella zoohelcum TaxID=1015 RepID=UPI000E20824C
MHKLIALSIGNPFLLSSTNTIKKDFPLRVKNPMTDSCCSKCYSPGCGTPSLEEHVNDSLSAMKFCGMQLEDSVPSYSVLSRFRSELTEKKAFDLLLSKINHQLEKHRIIIHQGVKVDASITQSSFHSKKPKTFEIAQD